MPPGRVLLGMKVQCQLCGATLRLDQFVTLPRPGGEDSMVLCTNEARCYDRMMFDPLSGENLQDVEARAERARIAQTMRAASRT